MLTPKLNQAAWNGVRKLLWIQVALTVGMTVVCGLLNGLFASYSAGLAGICCVISTAVFAGIVFRKSGVQAAVQIARSFYRAEAVKWLITFTLLVAIFVFVPIVAGAFFATFFVVQMAYWVALGLFR